MLDWIVSRKASHVLLLFGAFCIFFGCFYIDLTKSSIIPQLLARPNYVAIALGVLLLIAGTVAPIVEGVPASLKRLDGMWTYDVVDNELESSYAHGGVAEIFQKGNRVRIDGFRRYMSWQDSDGKHSSKVNIHWHTSWGWLDEEGVLRYDYDMAVTGRGGRIMGYVRIQITENARSPASMSGTYYIMPPYSRDLPNTQWGTITWQRAPAERSRWSRLFGHRTGGSDAVGPPAADQPK